MERVSLNGVEVYPFDSEEQLLSFVDSHKGILVAINADKIYNVDSSMRNLINSNIGYVDGMGVLKAVQHKGYKNAIRIPGCELWLKLIARNCSKGKTFYFIGGKQEVIDDVTTKLKVDYPQIDIAGVKNGYFDDNEREEVISDVAEKRPDFVFVAMGSPKQELLMKQMYERHSAVYMGLGGSFDLYTGRAKRAPMWFRRHGMEGLYRVITGFSKNRVKRYCNGLKFVINVYRNKY